ncbi:LysR substrate-binding domain-containing protein [Sphingomonas sp. 8AM]|uniref:LysR substrate-binding domain-containing protein n=1 Tax=Sphingomonas sp. 8AM TaxID=2653170 RepID=UPI0012F27EAE|nr:LysR family transcriptional regulator [Sphingomonas sp. 8AM]VXD01676.1 LysR family transcriptional regulator [Sphingomonas sp. 8AM]
MADRLTGMEVFVRAIRLGGLSAAGRAMGMSPTMAARHLDALEARLGTTLVNRTTRRLALTDAGLAYLDRAERILAEIAEADADASAQSRTVEGLLRVSAPATFGVMHVARLAAEFHRLHPGVTVELGLDDRHVDLLEERWDLAIRIGRLSDSSLIARRLAPMRLAICASPAYLAERGMPATLADLGDHDCLGYTLATLTGTAFWGFGRDGAHHVPVRGWLHANNGEALVRAAVAGQGLVYGPRFIAAGAIRRGELVEIALDADYIDLGAIHSVTHARRRPSARARAWLDFMADRIPQLAEDW